MMSILDDDPEFAKDLNMAFVDHKIQKTRYQQATDRMHKMVTKFCTRLYQQAVDSPYISEDDMDQINDSSIQIVAEEFEKLKRNCKKKQ